jgi:plastocyanin
LQHVRDRLWTANGLGGAFVTVAVAVLMIGVSLRGAQAQDGAAVSVVDFAFEPATIEVPAGTTVTWTNLGRVPHTVSDAGEFNSGLLAPGASFTLTFNAPGSYPYFCKIHPDVMQGAVVVTGAAAAAAEAPELAGVGVGTMAVEQTGTLAFLTAIAAAACALAALITYRRV